MKKLNFAKRPCAVLALCAATSHHAPGTTFGVLHSFDGTDGSGPQAPPIQGTDGNLYATTYEGGAYGLGNTIAY